MEVQPLINNDRDNAVIRVAANQPSSAELFPELATVYTEVSKWDLIEPLQRIQETQLHKFGYDETQIQEIWDRLPDMVPFRVRY